MRFPVLQNNGNYVKNSTEKRQFLNICNQEMPYFCFVKIYNH